MKGGAPIGGNRLIGECGSENYYKTRKKQVSCEGQECKGGWRTPQRNLGLEPETVRGTLSALLIRTRGDTVARERNI